MTIVMMDQYDSSTFSTVSITLEEMRVSLVMTTILSQFRTDADVLRYLQDYADREAEKKGYVCGSVHVHRDPDDSFRQQIRYNATVMTARKHPVVNITRQLIDEASTYGTSIRAYVPAPPFWAAECPYENTFRVRRKARRKS